MDTPEQTNLHSWLDTGLTNEWSLKSERWGHRLHSLCSYMATFPPRIPHYFIQKCTEPGDIVLDPFSGRGTTALQACLSGRIGVGNDLNPLAYTLTRAKTDLPDPDSVERRLVELERGYLPLAEANAMLDEYAALSKAAVEQQQRITKNASVVKEQTWLAAMKLVHKLREMYSAADPAMPFYRDSDYDWRSPVTGSVGYDEAHHHPIWTFYHPETLRQLCYLRENLTYSPTDWFIKAATLGIAHGRGRFYLSIPMPNTFSQSPNYVTAYTSRKRLFLPQRNVFACLRQKIALAGFPDDTYTKGFARFGNVRDLADAIEPILCNEGKRVKLVVSSPPYLGVVKYGLYNWIRLWFLETDERIVGVLGGVSDTRLDKLVDSSLDDGHHKLDAYLEFMRGCYEQLYPLMDPDGLCVMVLGDVKQKGSEQASINLADNVLRHAAEPAGFRHVTTIHDDVPSSAKVTRIWNERRGQATRVDRLLIVGKTPPRFYGTTVKW